MKCIIPCAGRSSRMGGVIPKPLLPVNGKRLLEYIVDYWCDELEDVIIIANTYNEGTIKQLCEKATVLVQEPLRGIADAILQARPFIEGKFIVSLGDCMFRGTFTPSMFDLGIGVHKHQPYDGGYTVDVEKDTVTSVYEKSDKGKYCGMGVYFFDQRVFDYIRWTPPSDLRNEVEITDVIQYMIESGEVIKPVWFEGLYVNVTYPTDLRKARKLVGEHSA